MKEPQEIVPDSGMVGCGGGATDLADIAIDQPRRWVAHTGGGGGGAC